MPSRSIYFDPTAEEFLAARTRGGEGSTGDRSAVVCRALDRYAEVVRRSTPALSPAEWRLVVDSLNGVIHEPAQLIMAAASGVADAIQLDGLAEKWHVDGPALGKKLRALSFPQLVALVDVAERYWVAVSRKEDPKVPGEG